MFSGIAFLLVCVVLFLLLKLKPLENGKFSPEDEKAGVRFILGFFGLMFTLVWLALALAHNPWWSLRIDAEGVTEINPLTFGSSSETVAWKAVTDVNLKTFTGRGKGARVLVLRAQGERKEISIPASRLDAAGNEAVCAAVFKHLWENAQMAQIAAHCREANWGNRPAPLHLQKTP